MLTSCLDGCTPRIKGEFIDLSELTEDEDDEEVDKDDGEENEDDEEDDAYVPSCELSLNRPLA